VQVPDTLDYLLGSWRVERRIEDRLSSLTGLFAGSATVTAAPGPPDDPKPSTEAPLVYYSEVGTLRWDGHDIPSGRILVVTPSESGRAVLRFPDGRHFVDIDLRYGGCDARHVCGDDVYVIELTVHSQCLYEESWRVRGPRKDYAANAIHERAIPKLR
jgi:hypothetical protein